MGRIGGCLIPDKDFATLQMQDGPLSPRLGSVALRSVGAVTAEPALTWRAEPSAPDG